MTLNITALAGGIGGARFLRGLRQLTRMGAVRGADYAAVRIDSPAGTPVFAA